MNKQHNQDTAPPSSGSTLRAAEPRHRQDELWASPQRRRYLRSLPPEAPAPNGLRPALR